MSRPLATRPRTPDDLTPEWFTAALGVEVSAAEIVEIVWGTATKVRVQLTIDAPTDLPASLCVKGPFDERLAAFDLESAYRTESHFFADIAPSLSGGIPRAFHAGDGIVVLDDLVAAGCTFGDPVEPWPVDRVAAALEAQAAWHRDTWDAAGPAVAALGSGSPSVRAVSGGLLSDEHWDEHAPDLPLELMDRERVREAIRALWRYDDAHRTCMTHGDAHVGNTYIDADGRPGFLDWQCIGVAPPFYDVAYFISGALTVDDRRRAEHELLEHYLGALAAGGGPVLPYEDAWADYRRYTMHGFFWALTPAVMQIPERLAAMADRYTTAIVDHDALALLEA